MEKVLSLEVKVDLTDVITKFQPDEVLAALDQVDGHACIMDYLDNNYAGESALYFARNVGYYYIGTHCDSEDIKNLAAGVTDNEDTNVEGTLRDLLANKTMDMSWVIDTLKTMDTDD